MAAALSVRKNFKKLKNCCSSSPAAILFLKKVNIFFKKWLARLENWILTNQIIIILWSLYQLFRSTNTRGYMCFGRATMVINKK